MGLAPVKPAATALAVSGITRHGKRVRLLHGRSGQSAGARKHDGKAGRIAQALLRMDLVILDELGYLPQQPGRRCVAVSPAIQAVRTHQRGDLTNLSFAEWSSVFGDAKMTTALLDRLTHHCHIVETGNESYRLQHSSSGPGQDKITGAKA